MPETCVGHGSKGAEPGRSGMTAGMGGSATLDGCASGGRSLRGKQGKGEGRVAAVSCGP